MHLMHLMHPMHPMHPISLVPFQVPTSLRAALPAMPCRGGTSSAISRAASFRSWRRAPTDSIDLTRALPGGFLDVMALDIDTSNGTLWVASAEADGRAATLHRLQLISGRVLASYGVPDGLAPARLRDVAVTASGAVLLLDAAKGRVLVLRSRTAAIEVLTILQPGTPTSLTVGSRDGVAYVAQREGLARIDLGTRVVVPLLGPRGTPLAGIEGLRRHGTSLLGVQTIADGVRRLVRLSLDATGRRVTALKVIDVPLPPGGAPIFTAVCGDTLAFLAGEAGGTTGSRSTVWTVRRIRLIR